MILAIELWEKETGQKFSCRSHGADYSNRDLLVGMNQLVQEHGGLPYATYNNNDDFSLSASVAAVAWLYFGNKSFNPFRPGY